MSSINSVRNLQMLYFSKKNKKIKNLKNGEKRCLRTPIYTYYYFYKFNCHRYSCNKGKVVFVFHVTLQDHVIKSL